MDVENAIGRAQLYAFLAEVFYYPQENWSEDISLVNGIADSLVPGLPALPIPEMNLAELQSAHRRTFGLAGSLCYETEYGLPHEYRQSQEMADLSGFYRAFGIELGSRVRERPDHIAVELEFMHFLSLMEAQAYGSGIQEHVEICREAQAKFLLDHLGRWVSLFAQSVAHNAPGSPFIPLASFASSFVEAHADSLEVTLAPPALSDVQHTPFDTDFSCAACELPGGPQGLIRPGDIKSAA